MYESGRNFKIIKLSNDIIVWGNCDQHCVIIWNINAK